MNLDTIFSDIDNDRDLTPEQLAFLLESSAPEDHDRLVAKGYETKLKFLPPKTYFRGIIELSNICEKDCYYCGIRKSNKNTDRFLIEKEEIIKSAVWAWENNYGSIALQAGERQDKFFIDFIEEIVSEITKQTNAELGITLSLGEQTRETYERWKAAGATRYLLRIETTNRELYYKLHPEDALHSFEDRVACLGVLRECGYQVGTGVMIGLPFQTTQDLVNDILFFKENDIDMIGMGPFIFHKDTPLNTLREEWERPKDELLALGIRMIATTRIVLKDVNIAATTALQALKHNGREMGVQAGANIIMPNTTATEFRTSYQLYENKPCMDENASMCRGCLMRRIEGVGETIGFSERGDSPHFFKRTGQVNPEGK